MVLGLVSEKVLQRQIEENEALKTKNNGLRSENDELRAKIAALQQQMEEMKKAMAAEKEAAVEVAERVGIQKGRESKTWLSEKREMFREEFSEQEKLAKMLDYIATAKEILPSQETALLKDLGDLMKSPKTNIMNGYNWDSRDSLLDQFLEKMTVYNSYRNAIPQKLDFLKKAFRIILNTQGRNGAKANMLERDRYGTNEQKLMIYLLRHEHAPELLDTVLSSRAFDMKKFELRDEGLADIMHWDHGGNMQKNQELIIKTLWRHGYDPEKDESVSNSSCCRGFKEYIDKKLESGKWKPEEKKIGLGTRLAEMAEASEKGEAERVARNTAVSRKLPKKQKGKAPVRRGQNGGASMG